MLIPTLSIRQPYCWAICHAKKDVENRDWSTRYRGPILIHASKSGTLREFEGSRQQILETFGLEVPGLDQLPRGGLVARAILADVVSAERYLERNVSPWYAGAGFAWLLERVEELRSADGASAVLPWPGRQGLFEVDWGADLRAQMQAAGLSWERAA